MSIYNRDTSFCIENDELKIKVSEPWQIIISYMDKEDWSGRFL